MAFLCRECHGKQGGCVKDFDLHFQSQGPCEFCIEVGSCGVCCDYNFSVLPPSLIEKKRREIDRRDDHNHAGYMLGVSVGWKEAADKLRTRAGEAYSQGADTVAGLCRELADEFDRRHERAREAYDSFKAELNQKEAK